MQLGRSNRQVERYKAGVGCGSDTYFLTGFTIGQLPGGKVEATLHDGGRSDQVCVDLEFGRTGPFDRHYFTGGLATRQKDGGAICQMVTQTVEPTLVSLANRTRLNFRQAFQVTRTLYGPFRPVFRGNAEILW